MIASVLLLADEYHATYPGELLRYNDMSLSEGGLFDVYGSNPATIWGVPHRSHRFGNDIDVGLVPRARRLALLEMLADFGLRIVPEGTPETHYHFRRR